jgi:hypothetical protein
MVELADFQAVVAVCLVVGRHVYPRCSRKKRTGESREKNAEASVTEQRSRQQRRPVVHAVKHHSTLRTNTDVSVRSAEKCTLAWNEVRKRNCSSWSVRELNARAHNLSCTQGRHGSARTCSLHCTLTPAACAARSARSVPGQDTRSGQGALARRHTDGPLWAALLKTTVMCEAWRRRTIAPPDPSRTADRPNPILLITGSSIPIPVPGQYRLSRCLK